MKWKGGDTLIKSNKVQRKQIVLFLACIIILSLPVQTSAMHIMEGYLPGGYCVAWGVICIPFLLLGYNSITNTITENPKTKIILAMTGACIFVISSLKIPSVTGSCSHMTGTGLGALLFGPCAVSVLGLIVLIFQAVLLAHGGLTSLGANTFSMAVAGPLVSYGVYWICRKCRVNKMVGIFLAAAFGDLFTYCVTSVQLAMAYPDTQGGVAASAVKFLGVFAPTQFPLAVIEGIITVIVMMELETYGRTELSGLKFWKGGVIHD